MNPERNVAVWVVAGVVMAASFTFAQAGPKVELKNAQGQAVGTASITAKSGGGVDIALDVKGLPPGEHAIHFHETAKCEGPEFTRPAPTSIQPKSSTGPRIPPGPTSAT